ncbi:MAG: hypothetical protein ACXWAT_00695 [Methylobacter sp.]
MRRLTEDQELEYDPMDYAEEDESDICTNCNGSGEGMHDGTRCSTCKGKGVS